MASAELPQEDDFEEELMRQLFVSLVIAVTLMAAGMSASHAGPHGCYSNHCSKH